MLPLKLFLESADFDWASQLQHLKQLGLVSLFILLCGCVRSTDPEEQSARDAYEKLRFMVAVIYQSDMDRGGEEGILSLKSGLQGAFEDWGIGVFQCPKSGEWAMVNADEKKWRRTNENPEVLMAFFPSRFLPAGEIPFLVGICFNGNRTNLNSIPEGEWISVGDVFKNE